MISRAHRAGPAPARMSRLTNRALETLAHLFPGRDVVVLEVDRIYENGGGNHCVTQHEPA